MGSKKSAKRRDPDRDHAELLVFTKRAKAEVKALLKRTREGTLTRKKLKTGLKEVEEDLKAMTHFIRYFV